MKCTKCGTDNRKVAAFCTNCGEPLKAPSRPASPRRKRTSSGNSGVRTMAYAFGALMIGLAILISQKKGPSKASAAGSVAPAPAFSVAVRDVASKFLCACGTCDVPELADCTCPTALEEKTLIDQELKRGTAMEAVIKLVNDRYGKIKPQFASLVTGGGASSQPAAPTRATSETAPVRTVRQAIPPVAASSPAASSPAASLPAIPPPLTTPLPEAKKVATEADARTIASQFICACNQCQNEVLADCDCDHPRGAVEMKSFIRFKISQQRYTRQQIVQAVAYEYGHRIQKD